MSINRKMITLTLSLALVAASGCAKKKSWSQGLAVELDRGDRAVLYAAGVDLGRSVRYNTYVSEDELQYIVKGMIDGALDRKVQLSSQQWEKQIAEFRTRRLSAAAAAEKEKAKPVIAAAAQAEDAQKLESGAILRRLHDGSGAPPQPWETVKARYRAHFVDDSVYDDTSSREDGVATLTPSTATACMREALLAMNVGSKARVVCPSEALYGDYGLPPRIPPGGSLIFEDLEIVGITRAPSALDGAPAAPKRKKS